MKLIDLDDDRHTYIGYNGEYEIWSIDTDVTEDELPVTRCEHCESHRNRVGICDVWHAHTNPDGYCHRGRKYGKND